MNSNTEMMIIRKQSQPMVVTHSSIDNQLVQAAREFNRIDIKVDLFSSISNGYYCDKISRNTILTGKCAEDRKAAIDLLFADARENGTPVFCIHGGSFTPPRSNDIARVRFQNGGTSGYWPLKWLSALNASEILSAVGERILGHDPTNREFFSIIIELFESVRERERSGVTPVDLASFPFRDIERLFAMLPDDEAHNARKRYEVFKANHNTYEVEQLSNLLKIPRQRGNCTVGGVIENNAEMFFDLSRFPKRWNLRILAA